MNSENQRNLFEDEKKELPFGATKEVLDSLFEVESNSPEDIGYRSLAEMAHVTNEGSKLHTTS